MNGDAELARVKAAVKTWEKAFRAEHRREPTKADIKSDGGNIAEQYALYRRLSKASKPSSSQSGTTSSAAASAGAKPASQTNGSARGGHHGAEPSTPTPPRRGSALPSPPRPPSLLPAASSSTTTGDKRRAAPSTPQRTPKRPKAYAGPIYDPNPNPFSVTPKKRATPVATSPFQSFVAQAKLASPAKPQIMESPFIIANSPKRLQELLKANSLQARRERAEAEKNTPRTRARKRLAGEAVDDSPVAVRQRRGQAQVNGKGKGKSSPEPFGDAFQTMEDDEDDDYEFGETPVKAGVDSFALLASGGKPKQPKLGLPPHGKRKESGGQDLFPMFKRAAAVKEPSKKAPSLSPPAAVMEEAEADQSPRSPSVPPEVADTPEAATKGADLDMADAPTAVAATPKHSREHILDLSDDEWDPEASPKTLRITGTKRQAIRIRPDVLASDDEGDGEVSGDDVEEEEDDESEAAADEDPAPAPGPDADRMLSLLSLRSPSKRREERLADLRVRALLDPKSEAAIALRAHERGQDVFTSGEGVEEDPEDELLEDRAVILDGDDDWESDPEGWKAEAHEEAW